MENSRRDFIKQSGLLLGGLFLSGQAMSGVRYLYGGTEPYIGEICIFPFDFAPRYWAQCNGQLLPVQSNQALFSLLGQYYGGDGHTNFALPNLQGRVPLHASPEYALGSMGGTESATLFINHLPPHIHGGKLELAEHVGDTADQSSPVGNYPAENSSYPNRFATDYDEQMPLMNNNDFLAAGGGQPHYNMQPYTVLNFCIALQGIYPSRP